MAKRAEAIEAKRMKKVLNGLVVLSIILAVFAASGVPVSSLDPPPPPPSIDNIIVTAAPPWLAADGASRSTITATVIAPNMTGNDITIIFTILDPKRGTTLTKSSDQILNYSDTNRNAYTELIAGTELGVVTIRADAAAVEAPENTTTVELVSIPVINNWYNNETKDKATSLTIAESECVYFSATATLPIDVWNWSVNDVDQGHNSDEFTYCGWDVNGTYTVKVTATNFSTGTSNPVTWTVTVNDITPPAQVTGLMNSTPTFSTVDLSWTANSETDLAGYKVYKDGVPLDTTSNTYYNVTALLPGRTYEFNVTAYDDNDLEGEPATVMVSTLSYPGPVIIDWYNDKTQNNAVLITINESECVYFNATADQAMDTWRWFVNDVNQSHNVDEFTYCGWDANGTYSVKVNATSIVNGTSNDVTWTVTVNDITPPAQVTGLMNGTPTFTTVDLSWTANLESDLAGYKVYKDGVLLDTTSNPYYNVTGLFHNTTYEFKVSAYDDNGLEGENATVMVTTPLSPDADAPIVTNPTADPAIIPDDTDNNPLWNESSNLSVTVTDASNVTSVTINLAAIGGSATAAMTRIGGSDVWNLSTNASVGTAGWNGSAYVPHQLQVTATDEHGNPNTSVSIELTVMMNGDVTEDGVVDFQHDGLYLVRHTLNVPGYATIRNNIAEVTGDGIVDFQHDGLYLVRHTLNVPGYEVLH